MNDSKNNAAEHFARIVRALKAKPGVTLGASKKGFGSTALCVHGKIFAMVSSNGSFVVKLPKDRVDALVVSGEGLRFAPGTGRVMKEWLAVAPPPTRWISLASEAMTFVGAQE
jgi:hypothetical protein